MSGEHNALSHNRGSYAAEMHHSILGSDIEMRELERERVAAILLGKTAKEIVTFAKEYYISKDWHRLCLKSWQPTAKQWKYQPGDLVFSVSDDSTIYIFVASMHKPGSSATIALTLKGELIQLVNIQYAEEVRPTTRGLTFRRIVLAAAVRGAMEETE